MKIRKLFAIVLCLGLVLSFVGCGASANDMAYNKDIAFDQEIAYGSAAPEASVEDFVLYQYDSSQKDVTTEAESPSLKEEPSSLPENRKLIQTVRMNVETEDLDSVLKEIDNRIAEFSGYIENSSIQNGSAYSGRRYRSADMTIRIPAKNLDAFINKVGEVSNIVSSNKSVEDITLNYVATESRMKALQTEETRLLELLAKAETMDDLLTVEKRLTEVRTDLEQVTSALRVFDNQVDYATIHLNIDEVKEYTNVKEPETVWERIGTGFMKSLKGVGNFFVELFVFLIVGSPYFVLIALMIGVPVVIILLIIKLITSILKKKKDKEKKKEAKKEPKKETENDKQ